MIIIKLLEASIHIKSDKMFSKLEEIVMHELSTTYIGKCFQNAYIVSINRVIKHSEVRVDSNNIDGSGIIDVIFETTAIIYMPGEVLVGKIVHIDPAGFAILKTDNTIITTNISTAKLYSKDMLIPVRVVKAAYTPMSDDIVVNAKLFTRSIQQQMYWNANGTINISLYMKFINLCNAILDKLSKQDDKIVAFFYELLGIQKPTIGKSTTSKTQSLLSIKELPNVVFMTRDSQPDIITLAASKEESESWKTDITSNEASAIYSILISNYYTILTSLNTLVLNYNTPTAIDQTTKNGIWEVYYGK